MILEYFTALVGVLAVCYAMLAKFIQNKLVDRSKVEAIQAESKKLSEEFKKAKESGNQAKIDAAMKKQMEFLPKMNKVMMAQFKPMIVILGIFFIFTYGIGQVDPFDDDDLTIAMADDGTGCDEIAGDGIFSACHELSGDNYGKWNFKAKALDGDREIGHNSTYFYYNGDDMSDTSAEGPKGEPVKVSTDKTSYSEGETIKLYAYSANANNVDAILDNGTAFYVDLPVEIPVVNVKRIQQPYWWFILVSLIANLSLSFAIGKLKKKGKK